MEFNLVRIVGGGKTLKKVRTPKKSKLQLLEGVIAHTNWEQQEFPMEFLFITPDEREYGLDIGHLNARSGAIELIG